MKKLHQGVNLDKHNFDIDFILLNKPQSFQHLYVIKTGFSQVWLLHIRTTVIKLQLKAIKYSNYRNFENNWFKIDLLSESVQVKIAKNGNDLIWLFQFMYKNMR